MSKTVRVFHPKANAWQDVASSDVKDWTDAGWSKTKGKHIDDSDALPVEDVVVEADKPA